MNKLPKHRNAWLSVCIPIYNHADRLRKQLDSLDGFVGQKSEIEFVFVDDASTDDLTTVLPLFEQAGWVITTARQPKNQGRAAAMARAIRMATGRYVMIMDGDDAFEVGALDKVLAELKAMQVVQDDSGRNCIGLVFGTVIETDGKSRANNPPDGLLVTLLGLRADLGVRGDLKEVIRRDVVTNELCPLFENTRRVPTSLLWSRISEQTCVLCKAHSIVQKAYLPGGMTKSLTSYRRDGIPALLELYATIARSTSYRSHVFRIRAIVNYHRFLAWPHSGQRLFIWSYGAIPAIFGYAYGLYERPKLTRKLRQVVK